MSTSTTSSTSSDISTLSDNSDSTKASLSAQKVIKKLVSFIKSELSDPSNYKFNLRLVRYIGTYIKSFIKKKHLKLLNFVDLVIGVLKEINDYSQDETKQIQLNIAQLEADGKIVRLNFFKKGLQKLLSTVFKGQFLETILVNATPLIIKLIR